MRTTISIDDGLMHDLMSVHKGATRSEAVRRAIEEYVYQRRVDEFLRLAGSGLVDLDWREAERQELEELEQVHTGSEKAPHGRKRSSAR